MENLRTLDNAADVKPAITEMKNSGYDAIKAYDKLSLEVYDEIIRVSKNPDISVVGHVPKAVGFQHAIESGQHSIVIYNGSHLYELKHAPESVFVSKERQEYWQKLNSSFNSFEFDASKKLLNELYKNNSHILAGTDTGAYFAVAGFSLHQEFEYLLASGMINYDILKSTTINAARMLGVENRLGTIEVGKDADLVLLDKNPLENISNTRTIEGIMSKGYWMSKETL